jgi:hypothetical protein
MVTSSDVADASEPTVASTLSVKASPPPRSASLSTWRQGPQGAIDRVVEDTVSAYQDSRPPGDQPARLCVPRLCSAPQRGGRRGNCYVDDDEMPVQLHRAISRGAPNKALSQQSSSHVMIVVMVVMVVVVVVVMVVVVVVVVALLGER